MFSVVNQVRFLGFRNIDAGGLPGAHPFIVYNV